MQTLCDIQNLLNEYDMLIAVLDHSQDPNVHALVEMTRADIQQIVNELNAQYAPLFEALQTITEHVRDQVVESF